MRFDTANDQKLQLNPSGGTSSLKPVLGIGGQGPQGLPGNASAAWTAATAVTTGTVRQAPDGSWIKSIANRTTGATFDATEKTFWTATLATAGTLESDALSASYAEKLGAASVSASATLAVGTLTKVSASGGARAMTIPDGTIIGQTLAVQKSDTTTNAVTATGKIRSTGSTAVTLGAQYDGLSLVWTGTFWDINAGVGSVPRDFSTKQWHFDVPQGKNNGTYLPFTSRTVDSSGNPVAEQINAKPTTDLSEGIIDWQHNSAQGDLIHLTAGTGMTNNTNSAALIALGLDKGYPTGLFVNNKGTADRGIGIKIEQNSSINVATDAHGLEVNQHSSTSPAVKFQQDDATAPMLRLQANSSIAANTTYLIEVIAAGATKGVLRAKTGELYWLADVITHDGGGFLNIATGVGADSNMTKQLSDGFNIRAYSGSAGVYYPGRMSRASSGLKLDVAPNTSGGPNWTGPTWQSGIAIKPGTAAASTMLGITAPATTATEGFPYMPSVAGAPTGVPTAQTGYSPFLYDTTNNKLWVYNGAWKGVVLS